MDVKRLGRGIKLPELETIFPIKCNPLHESPEVKKTGELIGEFSSMSAERLSKLSNSCLFSAYFHPFVSDLTKYLNLCKAMILFFMIDDHTECDWGDGGRNPENSDLIWDQIDQCFERLISGNNIISMGEWKPYVVALFICFDDIFKELSMPQKIRMAKEYKRYGKGNKLEGQIINSGHRFKTIEEYLEIRKLSIAVMPCCMMIEYADSIELTDEEWQELTVYMEYCAICVALANDFYSIEKELKDQKDHAHFITNIVAMIMCWDSCSIEIALKKTAVIINEYENKTKVIQDQLLDRADISADMKRVIENIQYIVSGNFCVCLMHQRYCEVVPLDA